MKFTCAKTILSEAISVCSHAVSSKSGESVIEGILFRCGEDVRMTGYNYKVGITKAIDADVSRRGQAVINARVLGDIVRKLVGETVTIDVDERPSVTITCGAAKFNIMAMSASDYPTLPDVEKYCGINFTNSSLKSIINQTIFAVSDNENKSTHTGALFELQENQLTVVGVDGYRMAVRQESVITTLPEARFIVPGDALKELSRILPDNDEPCCVFTTKKFALFEFDTLPWYPVCLKAILSIIKPLYPQISPSLCALISQNLSLPLKEFRLLFPSVLRLP
jgi:DNA polymerase-3 subunit beta